MRDGCGSVPSIITSIQHPGCPNSWPTFCMFEVLWTCRLRVSSSRRLSVVSTARWAANAGEPRESRRLDILSQPGEMSEFGKRSRATSAVGEAL